MSDAPDEPRAQATGQTARDPSDTKRDIDLGLDVDLDFDLAVPAFAVPEARVFAASTRLADFDTPAIEEILRPGFEVAAHDRRVTVRQGPSRTHIEQWERPDGGLARLKHQVKERLHRRLPVQIVPDGSLFDARFLFLGNIAHLVHGILPLVHRLRAELAERVGPDAAPLRLIVPAEPPPLAARFLAAAGLPFVAADGVVEGRQIEIGPGHDISLLREVAAQPGVPAGDDFPERIYVARRGERAVLNEDAMLPILEARGYTRIFLEDHALERQWGLLAHAREIVGIHGAGLANVAFSLARAADATDPGAPHFRLIELFSAGFANNCFRQYAGVLGGTWTGVRGRITSDIVRDLDERGDTRAHAMASFEVDLEALEAALAHSDRLRRDDLAVG